MLGWYVGFSGRARGSEFWYSYLFSVLVLGIPYAIVTALVGVTAAGDPSGEISPVASLLVGFVGLIGLALFLPSLPAGGAVRRTPRGTGQCVVTFTQAVSSVLGQYAGFRGRARRSEFWWWNLFTLLVGLAVAVTEVSLGVGDETRGPVSTLLALALLLPNLSVSVRRLHDSSRSGWWMLIALVPFAGIVVLLVFFLSPSTTGWNRYGPDPRSLADEQSADQERTGQDPSGQGTGGSEVAGGAPTAGGSPPADGEPAGAGWVPPGWDLPSAAEPGAGRPAQDRPAQDRPAQDRPAQDRRGQDRPGDDPEPDRPSA